MRLGVFVEPSLTLMMNGEKTIESRLSKHKIVPYDNISNDDIVIIKKSSGPIIGILYIREMLKLKMKSKSDLMKLKEKYNDGIFATTIIGKTKNALWCEKGSGYVISYA